MLCLGGALQFHHSAVRSRCVCASPYGLINECVHWQIGLMLRMWLGVCFILWVFVCQCEQWVLICVCVCRFVYPSAFPETCGPGRYSAQSNLLSWRCRIWYFLRLWPNIIRSLIWHSSLISSIPCIPFLQSHSYLTATPSLFPALDI